MTNTNIQRARDIARDMIKKHEGFRKEVYKCPAGYLTVGYGRNLETVGVSEHEALIMLVSDMGTSVEYVRRKLMRCGLLFSEVSPNRIAALIDFVFNVGATTSDKFKKMWSCIDVGDWHGASVELMNSKYAEQVGKRAVTLSNMLAEG